MNTIFGLALSPIIKKNKKNKNKTKKITGIVHNVTGTSKITGKEISTADAGKSVYVAPIGS